MVMNRNRYIEKLQFNIRYCWFLKQMDMLDKKYPGFEIKKKIHLMKKYPTAYGAYISSKRNELKSISPCNVFYLKDSRTLYRDFVSQYERYKEREKLEQQNKTKPVDNLQRKFDKRWEHYSSRRFYTKGTT